MVDGKNVNHKDHSSAENKSSLEIFMDSILFLNSSNNFVTMLFHP